MNEDLKEIFNNLGEGILLYSEENNKVVLANPEFKRLFHSDNSENDIL